MRELSYDEARSLRAGDEHYMAYVGPPAQYDFMGATQFRLLCALGLREDHKLLDFGCGSLRAGRLFIPYLKPGNYFGLEPNSWLVDDGVKQELGESILEIKKPVFRNDSDFTVHRFGQKFDFILAQSIFSHTGADLIESTLGEFSRHLNDGGLVAATFIRSTRDFGESGWVYPGVVRFRHSTIDRLIRSAGLIGRPLPWYHPRQTWYVLARSKEALPSLLERMLLTGAVTRSSEFKGSVRLTRLLRWAAMPLRQIQPRL